MSLLLALTSSGGITANLSATDGADTLVSASVIAIQATASLTEGADSLISVAVLAIAASASLTEGSDTLSSSAVLAIAASASLTEGADTVSSVAVLAIFASSAITEGADTLGSTATVGSTAITANLSATEGADNLTSTAALATTATPSQEVELRKYYMRKGKKLLMFDSVTEAEAYTEAEILADEAIAKAHKTSRLARKRIRTRIIADALPAQMIDTDWLTEMMQRFAINLDLSALLAEQDYNRVAEIYAQAMAMQDEEDIELLLMMGRYF